MQRVVALRAGEPPVRALHAKPTLAVAGAELRFRDDLVPDLQHGFVRPDATYPVVLRFSNAAQLVQPDAEPDMRGVALRVQVSPDDQHRPAHDQRSGLARSRRPSVRGVRGRLHQAFARRRTAVPDPAVRRAGDRPDGAHSDPREAAPAEQPVHRDVLVARRDHLGSHSRCALPAAPFTKHGPGGPRSAGGRCGRAERSGCRGRGPALGRSGRDGALPAALPRPGVATPIEDTAVEWSQDDSPAIPIAGADVAPMRRDGLRGAP